MSNTSRTAIAVTGASGRMGQMIIQSLLAQPDLSLVAALDRADSPWLGQDAGLAFGQTTGVKISSGIDALAGSGADVVIDFTRPEASLGLLPACLQANIGLVLGTTGFDAAGHEALKAFAQRGRLVMSPNMSVGVNITLKLLEVAGHFLKEGFDIEVIEAHHRHKVDAPSGTALRMGEVVANATGRPLPERAVWARQGHTGPRTAEEIGFSVIRGGDIIGDHTVLFAGAGERIEVTHKSSSRATYAEGSLRAARFLQGKPAGLYDMQDVLGLRSA